MNPNGFTGGGGGLGVQLGNPDLKSEEGKTWTVGTVLRSPFEHALLRNMTATMDFYKATIDQNIGLLRAQDVLDACFNSAGQNPTYSLDDLGQNCAKIQRDPFGGGLSRVVTPYANLGGLETRGLDLSFNWSGRLNDMHLPLAGRISLSAQGTRVFHYISQTTPGSAPVENVGYSNLPAWRTVTRLNYFTGTSRQG